MSLLHTLQTLFEIVMVIAVVWCLFNEDKLIAFERRIFSAIRRKRLRVVKSSIRNSQFVIHN